MVPSSQLLAAVAKGCGSYEAMLDWGRGLKKQAHERQQTIGTLPKTSGTLPFERSQDRVAVYTWTWFSFEETDGLKCSSGDLSLNCLCCLVMKMPARIIIILRGWSQAFLRQ